MKPTDYSNREIDMKFNGIHEKLDTIIVKVTKTNGTVMKHEKVLWLVTGGLVVLGAMSSSNLVQIVKAFTGV